MCNCAVYALYQLAEECQGLRRLQAFRRLNTSALISLSYYFPAQDTGSTERNTSNKTREVSQEPLGRTAAEVPAVELETTATEEARATTVYRLDHLACSLRPTVSCYKVDHTRAGHPSDVPPVVNTDVLRKAGVVCGVDDMLRRLIIPNDAPTSIRCVDNHWPSMAPTWQQGVGDSLSIAHQRQALLAVTGRRGGSTNSCSSSSSTLGSSRTTNTIMLSPSST